MSIRPEDFDYVREMVYDHSAIVLNPGKEYLVESRMQPLINQQGLDSIAALVAALRSKPYSNLHKDVIEAMTTNETSFFRDMHPFEAVRKNIFPEMMKSRANTRALHIWCGACSSGQEPYSLAMLIREHFPMLNSWKVNITASDLSDEILAKARQGCYGPLEVNRGLPAPLLVKYFERHGTEWKVKDILRDMITFHQMNLTGVWDVMPHLDMVMLRNVLIYFDQDTKRSILGNIRRLLKPDGYLFLGSAETTFNIDDAFERVMLGRAVAYRLKKTA